MASSDGYWEASNVGKLAHESERKSGKCRYQILRKIINERKQVETNQNSKLHGRSVPRKPPPAHPCRNRNMPKPKYEGLLAPADKETPAKK